MKAWPKSQLKSKLLYPKPIFTAFLFSLCCVKVTLIFKCSGRILLSALIPYCKVYRSHGVAREGSNMSPSTPGLCVKSVPGHFYSIQVAHVTFQFFFFPEMPNAVPRVTLKLLQGGLFHGLGWRHRHRHS